MTKKIKVCKTDAFLKEDRIKINRALTIDDVVKVMRLIHNGYSIRKIYLSTGYNIDIIRNSSRLYSFLKNLHIKEDLDKGLTDKPCFLSLFVNTIYSINEERLIEEMIALIIHSSIKS